MSPVEFSLNPLHQLARTHFGSADYELESMPGGASLRRFFRVAARSQTADKLDAVGMFFPDAANSEEATHTSAGVTEWPFLEVHRLLSEVKIKVPRLFGQDLSNGWLLIEDLGENTLAQVIERDPSQKEGLYQQAVADLTYAQRALSSLASDSIVCTRAFDTELLGWEIRHFRQWALEAQGVTLTAEQSEQFETIADQLAQRIANLQYGFVHRDYQSRNLMVTPNSHSITWIDFQDAMLGPRVYDLVALLGDSYQHFSDEFIDARLSEYCAQMQIQGELALVRKEFEWVMVQRKLKDAGRFVFIDQVKGDSAYLSFIEPTVCLIRKTLKKLESDDLFRELSQLLDAVWPLVGKSKQPST